MTGTRRNILTGAVGLTGLCAAGAGRAVIIRADIFPVVETAQGKVRGVAGGGVKMFKELPRPA